jgi:hypothetical protein
MDRCVGSLVVAIRSMLSHDPMRAGPLPGRPRRPSHPGPAGQGLGQYTAASGYPQILLVALVACGTRAILDAVFGPRGGGETGHGQRLARSLRPGMIVLLDRGLSGNDFLA